MYLHSIAHSLPPAAFTQKECWSIIADQPQALERLRPGAIELLKKLLLNPDSSIRKRHFCAEDFARVFQMDPEYLNALYEQEAPKLAAAALQPALEKAGLNAGDLDALFVCSCTGYLCPGVSSYLSENLQMKPDAYLQDLVGLGCGAAIPMLRSASGFHALKPDATIACIAVEACSTAFFLDNDPGVLISLCLFGDGASATIWGPRSTASTPYRLSGFQTLHLPEHREKLRFRNHRGCLRNQLHRSLPAVAAQAVEELWNRSESPRDQPIASHGGGRDVLEAIETRLGWPRLDTAHEILAECGNLSSPSVLLAAERHLQSNPSSLWLTSFGAGFAAHSVFLKQDS